MLKLILSDLDGTLLNGTGHYNEPHFAQVMKQLTRENIAFAAVTGKQCERVETLFPQQLNNLYILGDSATRIKYQGNILYESLIKPTLIISIIKEIERLRPDCTIIACTKDGAVVSDKLSSAEQQVVAGSYESVRPIHNLLALQTDCLKITIHDPLGQAPALKAALNAWETDLFLVASEDGWLDITAKNVHKGSTVARLQQLLNVTAKETVAFGDGRNDIELLEQATYSFAMRNACPELKEAAFFITQSNDEDGVLNTIDKLLALQTKN